MLSNRFIHVLLTRAGRALSLAVLLTGCTTQGLIGEAAVPAQPSPLLGKVFRGGSEQPVDIAALRESMLASNVVYLGETHDNREHHRNEQRIVDLLLDAGARPVLGFEFFSREQTSHLLRYRNGAKRKSAHGSAKAAERLLRAQLGWEAGRELDWQRFIPMLRQARQHQLPIFGADLAAALRLNLARQGVDGLNPVERLQLTATDFEDPVYRDWMLEKLQEAHCGWGNPAFLQKLYETWNARNQAMAEAIVAMVKAHPEQPVVVILGGAHTEYDMGVYERVRHLMPGIRQMNLRMRQVDAEKTGPSQYFAHLVRDDRDFGPPHEYIWITGGNGNRLTHCAKFHASRPKKPAAGNGH